MTKKDGSRRLTIFVFHYTPNSNFKSLIEWNPLIFESIAMRLPSSIASIVSWLGSSKICISSFEALYI